MPRQPAFDPSLLADFTPLTQEQLTHHELQAIRARREAVQQPAPQAIQAPPQCANCREPLGIPFEHCAPSHDGLWICARCLLKTQPLWAAEAHREYYPGCLAWPFPTTTASRLSATLTTGVEFEMYHRQENTNRIYDLAGAWELASCGLGEDGSIKSNAGIEVKTPPLTGHALEAMLRAVCSTCQGYGMTVDKSCGLHVHVGIPSSWTTAHHKALVLLTRSVEPVLFAMLPGSRWNNGYSAAIRLSANEIQRVRSANGLQQTWRLPKNGSDSRYKGLNLEAGRKYGTIEFRYHSGTLNAEKVLNWVEICQRLMLTAENTHDTIAAIPTTFTAFSHRLDTMLPLLGLTHLEGYIRERIKQFEHNLVALERWAASLEADVAPFPSTPNMGDEEAVEPISAEHCEQCGTSLDDGCDCHCPTCEEWQDDCTCCGACGESQDNCSYCGECQEPGCECTCNNQEEG